MENKTLQFQIQCQEPDCFGTKEFHQNSGICMRCKDYPECKKTRNKKLG